MTLLPCSLSLQIRPEVPHPVCILWSIYFVAYGHVHCAGLDELHCRTGEVCRQTVLWGEMLPVCLCTRQSWGGRVADCVYILVKSFRSAFTLNYDVINHHVTPSAGNVHSEILTSCTPGTMFHHKHITVGSFLVQRFLFNVS